MFTQCPQCQTVFRVTAAMLKAAQGRVRCGRCAHVFNALTFLIEHETGTAGEPARQVPAAASPATPPAPPKRQSSVPPAANDLPFDPSQFESGDIPESALEFSADDLSKVFVVAPAPTLVSMPALGAATPQPVAPVTDEDTAEHEILDIELETPGSPEIITLEGDSVVLGEEDPSVSAEYFVEEEPSGEEISVEAADDGRSAEAPFLRKKAAPSKEAIDAEVRREIEAAFAADPTTRAEFTLPSGRRLEIGRAVEADEDDTEVGAQLEAARQRRQRIALGWTIASAVLALTFLMQLVHYNRQSLARNAAIGPMISGIYAAIGSELAPQWNVRAYELRQFGAAAHSAAGGTLRVRASLLNDAVHAQPYPVLRLTLQDRFGGQVGSRDLEPREYLQAAPARNTLLGAGQRVDADIAIVDPGREAVGFEIDVCLRATPQHLTCANDAPRNAG